MPNRNAKAKRTKRTRLLGTRRAGRRRRPGRPERSDAVDATVAAAETLFAEQGYEATTVSDIIAKAGIARATFYKSFSSKEHVLLRIYTRQTKVVQANVSATIMAHADIQAAIEGGVADYVRAWVGLGEIGRVLITAHYESRLVHECREQQVDAYVEAVRKYLAAIGQDDVPPMFIDAVLVALDRLAQKFVAGGADGKVRSDAEVEAFVEQLGDLLRRYARFFVPLDL